MPELSALLAKYPGPTVGDVEDNPEKYPQEHALLLQSAQSMAATVLMQDRQVLQEHALLLSRLVQPTILPMQESLAKAAVEAASYALEQMDTKRILDNWLPMSQAIASIPIRGELPGLSALLEPAVTNLRVAMASTAMAPIRRMFEPGTLQGDLMLAWRDKDAAALERLARRFKWEPRGPAAKVALALRAQEVGRERARVEAMMVGIFMALQRTDEPQRMRFGAEYVVDEGGRPALLQPRKLPFLKDMSEPGYWRWLRKEAINAAEAWLLGTEYPAKPEPASFIPHDEAILLHSVRQDADPLEAMIQIEEQDEAKRIMAELEAIASPRQRQLLAAMLDAPTLADAATIIGMDPATARVQILRLRRKFDLKMAGEM